MQIIYNTKPKLHSHTKKQYFANYSSKTWTRNKTIFEIYMSWATNKYK